MTPLQAWLIYGAIVAVPMLAIGLIVYSSFIIAGRYDERSERLFEENSEYPELKDDA